MATVLNLNDKVKFIIAERQMTPSHFADEIGVQRSSISHILSGRNRPSLEIIQKIVARFPEFTYEWLLEQNQEASTSVSTPALHLPDKPESSRSVNRNRGSFDPSVTPDFPVMTNGENSRVIEKILIFFSDKTFTEYRPE